MNFLRSQELSVFNFLTKLFSSVDFFTHCVGFICTEEIFEETSLFTSRQVENLKSTSQKKAPVERGKLQRFVVNQPLNEMGLPEIWSFIFLSCDSAVTFQKLKSLDLYNVSGHIFVFNCIERTSTELWTTLKKLRPNCISGALKNLTSGTYQMGETEAWLPP